MRSELRFSRHAKNSMRLYRISPTDVELTIGQPDRRDQEGNYLIAYRQFFRKYENLPLKVIYVIEKEPLVITVYPLKKSYRG